MPIEIKTDPRGDFTRRVLPWLTAALMLAVYLLTLNHWVSLFNISTVAKMSGWLWVPDLSNPLYHLVTLPIRLLPVAIIPLALNLFSAVCAALTLCLLVRSVGLLPHDRTPAQAARERNDFALLTARGAWMPPLLAALLCGLQLTFWELATNGGTVMFDLLLFAFVVWSLLEYRLDEREGRLYLSAAVVGVAIAEGPSMTGFFPLYVVAIIWIRGLGFFNWQFLRRMTLYGLAGLALCLLLPLMSVLFDKAPGTFLQSLKFSLTPQFQVLRLYFLSVANLQQYFGDLLMPLFISLVPLLVLSIRWKTGDSSHIGSILASCMFHSIHAIFLGVCIWLAFDPPFSPREKNFGLTLYYVIALSAGYYAGYFLLIFGAVLKRHPRGPAADTPGLVKLLNRAVVACVWVLGILAVTGLVYKNMPLIRAVNDSVFDRYTSLVTANLPREGGIVLSDDPERLYLTQAKLAREGRAKDFLLLDTTSLTFPQYHRFLHKQSPQIWPLLVSATNTGSLNPIGMMSMLNMLAKSNELYYLHPSYGYYFEEFYAEPHGLVYKLKTLPSDTLIPPPPDKNLIAENESFWSAAQGEGLASVEIALAPPPPDAPETFVQRQLARLHIPQEPNINANVIGNFCSRSLNFWGVELQRAGELANAAAAFQSAIQFNSNNVVAQINLGFNADLQAGRHRFVDLDQTSSEHLGNYNSIDQAVSDNGPFDEPSFCFDYGYKLQEIGYVRQSAAQFYRVYQFDNGYWPARIWLARIYGVNHLPDQVIKMLREPLEHPEKFSLNGSESDEAVLLGGTAYIQKNDAARGMQLFEKAISRNPSNDTVVATIAQIYIDSGLYSNALDVIERRLSLSPDDPNWLYMKGYASNLLKKYGDAIGPLTRVLAVQKDNTSARIVRADAYFKSGRLDDARADYKVLQQTDTNSFEAAYCLGEIAWNQHDTNEAIRNYQIYLANAPTNAAERETVIGRLHDLKASAGGK